MLFETYSSQEGSFGLVAGGLSALQRTRGPGPDDDPNDPDWVEDEDDDDVSRGRHGAGGGHVMDYFGGDGDDDDYIDEADEQF